MRKYFIAVLLFICLGLSAQPGIYLGSQIPLTYTIGADVLVLHRVSAGVQFGSLWEPYNRTILNVMQMGGTDEVIINTVGDAYKTGSSIQTEFLFHHNGFKIGGLYSHFTLQAEDAPVDAIENFYGLNIPDWGITNFFNDRYKLILHSEIHALGLKFGYTFSKLPIKNFEIHTDFDLMKIVASENYLKLNDNTLENISERVDEKMNEFFREKGVLMAFNVRLLYRFDFGGDN